MIEEKSCGVITILKKEKDLFLILKQTDGHWSFPKGHIEEGETARETALRELKEETGITKVKLANLPSIFEEYNFSRDVINCHKINEYFIGFVDDDKVTIQLEEISEYKWATFEEVLDMFNYKVQKLLMRKIKDYLDLENYSKRIGFINKHNFSEE